MFRVRTVPSLAIVLAGSMDCLTTIVGILFFGAVEYNPFLANITNTNLPAFVAIKLTSTILVALIFQQAEKILMKTHDKNSKSFTRMRYTLRGAYIGATAFLLIAVANNIIAVARVI